MLPHHPFQSQQAKEKYLTHYERRAKTWPIASESRLVETPPYGQTFVHIGGPVDARPLVLLPGIAFNSLMWSPNIEDLSKAYRTYAVDNLYDYGRSIPAQPLKSRDDFVNWLDRLFDALGLGNNINLMGISYGGWLTSQYTLRFPKRLAKIVLLAPAATVLPMRLGFILRSLGLVSRSKLLFWTFEDLARQDETGRKMVEDMAEDLQIASQCFQRLTRIYPSVLTDKELQSIKMPALFLVGENEKIYSAQKAVQRLNRVAPQIQTEIIPRAGHDFTFVQPEIVTGKILEFLKRH